MRRWLSILLVFCVCWQSLANAGLGVCAAESEEVAHALRHFEGSAHHHDLHDLHDAGCHQDDSGESTEHVMCDACLHAPALLTAAVLPFLCVGSAPPVIAHLNEPPQPFLSGPERPPQSLT
jgi:hypothetical protein